ncbi:MAG: ABC transporter ATP-binding protein/permease [Pseudomonadales bacterium]|jgi:ATP-binding cassette subfamily B protein|nr:ABC transporter ATP-binding protein/permease [Pseudomonadales bacterium]
MSENQTEQNQQDYSDPMGDLQSGLAKKAKDPKKTIRQLIVLLAPHKTSLAIVFFLAMFSTIFSVIGPRLLGRVTTTLVDGIVAYWMGTGLLTNFPYIATIIFWLIVLYIISALCSLGQGTIMARLSVKVTYKLRSQIAQKMHKLPISYYDTRPQGEVLSRITNDVDTMSQTFNTNLTQLITSSTTIVGVLIMMISISPLMTAASLIVIPLSMWIMMMVLKRSHVYFGQQQAALGVISGIVEETYGGHDIVRAYNNETDAEVKFDEANAKLRNSAWKAQFMTSIVEPIFGFVSNLGYVLACVLGGYLVVQRVVTIGDVQAFIQYIQTFTQPLGELGAASNQMQAAIAAAERVFEFLDEKEEVADVRTSLHKKHYEGKVSFQHIRFGYNPEKIIIKDFSAEVSPGQTVAIVGPTGAGKTTIVKLLMRFYELDSGKILIDDINIAKMAREELRNIFGMVLQDTWIYNTSIMENIRYGSPNATDEEVIAACKAAHCHNFIKALPGGYDMVLNEESSNISQGQKQLFTIARVILKNPTILILDEATSSIDTRTEILIQQTMQEIMKGRTSFVIAHRLSTIKNADVILVMKDGDIVEKGNHKQLLKQKGFYAELYNSQFVEGEDEIVSS